MKHFQLSLFLENTINQGAIAKRFAEHIAPATTQLKPATKKPKQPKLGRYDRLKRELEQSDLNADKIFVDINQIQQKAGGDNFVDFSGGYLYKYYADAFQRQYPGKPSMTVKENHGKRILLYEETTN